MIIRHKKHEIEVYENTQSLPILRFQKFNKYMMIAGEVGNTFEDYDARTSKALAFLQKGMVAEAMQELNNRRQMVYNAFNEFTPRGKAFAVLIKRIDGKHYSGNSPGELDEVLAHLEQIGLGYVNSMETLNEVKKNSKRNWRCIIRNIFQKTETSTTPHSE